MPQKLPERVRRFMESPRPFEFRAVQELHYLEPRKAPPSRQVWFRAVGRLPDEQMLHRCLLAYVSDFFLLDTATLPHGIAFLSRQTHHGEHRSRDVVPSPAARG